MLLPLALCALLLTSVTPSDWSQAMAAHAETRHDKAFWRMIVKNDYKPPAGTSPSELALELSKSLGSPDPEMRDELAYNILATWIYKTHQVDLSTLRALTEVWQGNLAAIPGSGENPALRRSFSALMLSVAVARDNAEPFLEEQEFRKLWRGALAYLAVETDLRGFDNQLGWIHSAAHTADLLKFLARSRYATREDQAALLAAVQLKLSTAPVVFIYGEDERYARTVLSVILRKDFDLPVFEKWAKDLGSTLHAEIVPSEQVLHGQQNVKNFLTKLDFILLLQTEPGPSVHSAEEAVRTAVKNTF